MRHRLLAIILLIILSSGCSLIRGDENEIEPTPTPDLPTPVATPTLIPTADATEPAISKPPTDLNIWIIPELAPDAEDPGSQLLADQLSSFAASHPDLNLNIEVKATGGQGGTLNYLRTGRDVAPTILPDLIIIGSDQLSAAAAEELIFPIDSFLNQEMLDDLYSAAMSLSRVGELIYGYPYFLTNFQHVAYNSIVLDAPLPETWDELVDMEDASFVFPAGGPDGAELALQFYLASGGQLADDANQPLLEVDPLTAALNYLSRGRNLGAIAPSSQNITTLSQAWEFYSNSIANIVQTEAPILLTERTAGDESTFSPIPGPTDSMYPLIKGWLWAVSTPDPVRQALAIELLSWLASGPNMGEWSSESGQLPSRKSAFDSWPAGDDYTDYLRSQLDFARPFPKGASNTVMSALSEAVFDVISQTKSPRLAAEDAAALLEQ
ncbi:MAG: hypothetical protein BMS9Abin02_0329 [Anaerolineae bacterium]|nr:MAG: hypothetical protein BMS9Abin02_0329 [Anaerolineae bacterium]